MMVGRSVGFSDAERWLHDPGVEMGRDLLPESNEPAGVAELGRVQDFAGRLGPNVKLFRICGTGNLRRL